MDGAWASALHTSRSNAYIAVYVNADLKLRGSTALDVAVVNH